MCEEESLDYLVQNAIEVPVQELVDDAVDRVRYLRSELQKTTMYCTKLYIALKDDTKEVQSFYDHNQNTFFYRVVDV